MHRGLDAQPLRPWGDRTESMYSNNNNNNTSLIEWRISRRVIYIPDPTYLNGVVFFLDLFFWIALA